MKIYLLIAFVLLSIFPLIAQEPKDLNMALERANRSTAVLKEFASLGEKSLPVAYLRSAKAVAVFPEVSKYSILLSELLKGFGVAVVRSGDQWSVPAFFSIRGNDMNLKIAGKKKFDMVVLFLDDSSVEALIKHGVVFPGRKHDPKIALGPVVKGEGADDVIENAKVIYYLLEDGQLIDVDLKNNSFFGAFGISADNNLNKKVYHLKAKEIFSSPDKVTNKPDDIEQFRTTLRNLTSSPTETETHDVPNEIF